MKSDKKSAFVSLQFVRICMTDEGTRHQKRAVVETRNNYWAQWWAFLKILIKKLSPSDIGTKKYKALKISNFLV